MLGNGRNHLQQSVYQTCHFLLALTPGSNGYVTIGIHAKGVVL